MAQEPWLYSTILALGELAQEPWLYSTILLAPADPTAPTIIRPHASDSLSQNGTYLVEWNASTYGLNWSPRYKLELTNGVTTILIADNITATNYSWLVSPTIPVGDWTLRVTAYDPTMPWAQAVANQ